MSLQRCGADRMDVLHRDYRRTQVLSEKKPDPLCDDLSSTLVMCRQAMDGRGLCQEVTHVMKQKVDGLAKSKGKEKPIFQLGH